MNKYIVLILLVLVAIFGGYYLSHRQLNKPNMVVTETSILPADWKKVEDKDVALKIVKTVAVGYQPQIVLIKSTLADAKNPSKYVDSLVAGAKSTIPSLKITEDKRFSEEGKYSALLVGFYTNQKQRINLIQRVYIKNTTVYTLTASFEGDLKTEVNKIFDKIELK